MIDFDFGPAVLGGVILIAYGAPMLYSFFVDNFDRKSPPVIAEKHSKH